MRNRARILLINDSMDLTHQLADILATEHEVIPVPDSQAAIAEAGTNPPDLILFNPRLAERNGYEVASAIRALPSCADIPMLALIAQGALDDERRAIENHAAEVVSLPLNPVIALTRINAQLTLRRQAGELRHLSLSDPLTGLGNLRAFEETLDKEWRRCSRAGQPMSLIVADIDHFRIYNEHYGRAAGNACLITIARALANCISRPSDLLSRTGGEEFSAILSGTDGDGAWRVVENIVAQMKRLSQPHMTAPAGTELTLSLGLASISPSFDRPPSLLVEAAEQQLRRAKHFGRNRCVAITVE